jgi:hypothetical protein
VAGGRAKIRAKIFLAKIRLRCDSAADGLRRDNAKVTSKKHRPPKNPMKNIFAVIIAALLLALAGCSRSPKGDTVLRLDPGVSGKKSEFRDCSGWDQQVLQAGKTRVQSTEDAERGTVLKFDGFDSCLRVAESPDLDLPQGFTLSVWIKVKDLHKQMPLLEWDSDGTHMWLNVDAYQWQGARCGANLAIQGQGSESVVATGNPETGRWAHLAVTCDITNHIGRVYLNHELKTDKPLPNGAPHTKGNLLIGNSPRLGPGGGFEGLMDDVRVIKRPLTPEEIRAL